MKRKSKKQKDKFLSMIPFMEIKNMCSQNATSFRRPITNKTIHIKHIRMTTFKRQETGEYEQRMRKKGLNESKHEMKEGPF